MDDKIEKLNAWATSGFHHLISASDDFYSNGETRRLVSEAVAHTTGAQAYRLGISISKVKKWLQSAYGTIWVRLSALEPELDMKDVQREVERAYDLAKRRCDDRSTRQ